MTNENGQRRERKQLSGVAGLGEFTLGLIAGVASMALTTYLGLQYGLEGHDRKVREETTQRVVQEYQPQRAYLADVNEDGFADIVVRNNSREPYMFLNTGEDRFRPVDESWAGGFDNYLGNWKQRAKDAEFSYLYTPNGEYPVWTQAVADAQRDDMKGGNSEQ